ncbi:MAG: DNA helicase PcrA [Hydrogenibacillus sp.]|nr:DNA helicase PcrA [Hydrogenibacillus sp.]
MKAIEDLLSGLNPKQREAVMTTEGPLLIVAGAGSGKTRVLTHRIAHLIARGVRPDEILAITFTNKAAREMRERTEALVGPTAKDVWLMTFHAFSARVLRIDGEAIGLDPRFTILDAPDAERLFAKTVQGLNLDEKKYPPKTLRAKISRLKNEGVDAAAFAREAADHLARVLAEVYLAYDRALQNLAALDFDDLLLKTLVLFRTQPEVLEKYRRRFRYIHIDEYQDTNRVQYLLVKLLAGRVANVCAVGDGDQSIYKWRGADIRNILDFERDFPQAKTILLEENYRSTACILEAANAVIAHNRSRKPKALWTRRPGGEKLRLYHALDEVDEARFIAREIHALLAKGHRPGDIAVLYRMNAQSRAIEGELARAGIAYRIVAGLRFYERKEIKDVLAYLRLIANPGDTLSLERIMNVPRRGIGDVSWQKALAYAEAHGLRPLDVFAEPEAAGIRPPASTAMRELYALIERLSAFAEGRPPSAVLEKALEESGYLAMLEAEGETEEGRARLENVAELATVAASYEAEVPGGTLADFLADLALVSDLDALEAADAVMLMTLHSAKGLEFPIVFIPGLDDGLFPSSRSLLAPDELEEERRLMYVGITRAKERLYLITAATRTIFGRSERSVPSRFLSELPETVVELVEEPPLGASHFGSLGGASLVAGRDASPFAERRTGSPPRAGERPVERFGGVAPSGADGRESGGRGAIEGGDRRSYAEGDRVRHAKWGEGVVVSVDVNGEDVELIVAFAKPHGIKKLLAAYAPLKIISSP